MKYKNKDVVIDYEEYGEGIPILMIHGYSVDKTCMVNSFEPIFKTVHGFKRVYIDLPHMGESNRPESINSSDDYLNLLISFIKDMDFNEYLVTGYSYGGYLARGLQEKTPNCIGAALVCPVQEAYRKNRTLPEEEVLYVDDFIKNYEGYIDESFENYQIQTEYTFKRHNLDFKEAFEKANFEVLSKIFNNHYELDIVFKKEIESPTLILLGKQDSVVGYEDMLNYIKNYKRLTLSIIDRAGHNLMTEQVELFELHIKKWLGNYNGDFEGTTI